MQHRSGGWIAAIAALAAGAALAVPGPAAARPIDDPSVATAPARSAAQGVHTRWQPAGRHAVSVTGQSARGGRAVPLGTSTQSFAIDLRTGTAYVSSDQGTVSVVDIAQCNITDTASCAGPVAELSGPSDAIGVAIHAHTLYVTSGVSGTNGVVSVYDISHCVAGDTSACGAAVATVPIADIPTGVALDRSTGTLYVGNTADHVDVLALASCRAADVAGCGTADVASIPAKDGPVFPTLDTTDRTLYVPANGPGADASGTRAHVIDLRHCYATDTSGCAAHEAALPAGPGAVVALLDHTTGTLYVQNQSATTVSVLDIRHCTGALHSGCAQQPIDVPVGSNPSGGMVEVHHRQLYVANSDSDTLSTFSTRHCRAGSTTGCPTTPPSTVRADGAPFALAYDSSSGTIFSVEHAGEALGVLDADQCGNNGKGCRHLLPSISGNEQQLADSALHTWYGVDAKGNLTLTDTRTCTAAHPGRCAAAAVHTSQPNTSYGQLVADNSTHSLYLLRNNPKTYRGSLVVLDTRTCNASVHTDCKPVAPAMHIPDYTAILAINRSTNTVYVTTQYDSTLQVIDGRHCNATRQTGCSAPVASVPLAGVVYWVTVDKASRTLYVSEFGADFDDNTVYAIDSSHCRAGNVSGCTQTPQQFTSGTAPLGMVDDPTHHTLYVLANAGGDADGQVDVFDTRTCSARGVSGCTPAAAFDVDRTPYVGALDPMTGNLFVADFEHAAVSEIATGRCNATVSTGCHDRQFDVGDSPGQVAIDPTTHSMFVLAGHYDRSYVLDTRLR